MPVTGGGLVDAVKVGTRPVTWNFGGGIGTFPQDVYVAGSGGYVGPMPARSRRRLPDRRRAPGDRCPR